MSSFPSGISSMKLKVSTFEQDISSASLGNNNIQINDLQFLIRNDGRAVVADPLKVNINTPPSNNNLRMIDLLIQSAKKNGSK